MVSQPAFRSSSGVTGRVSVPIADARKDSPQLIVALHAETRSRQDETLGFAGEGEGVEPSPKSALRSNPALGRGDDHVVDVHIVAEYADAEEA